MRYLLGLFLLSGALLAQDQPNEAAKKELAKCQGTWRWTTLEINGKTNEIAPANQLTFILKDNIVFLVNKDGTKKEFATLKIDPSTKPKVIDLTFKENQQTWEGIYQVEADKITLCVNTQTQGTKERPPEFKTANQQGFWLLVFQRGE
jgi:uncharacterized protein (TIGR03067 family)